MKLRAHATYAPSSAYKWMDCGPSVLIDVGENFKDSTSYSLEGDKLHHVAEKELRSGIAIGTVEGLTPGEADSVRVYVEYVLSRPGKLWVESKSWFIQGLSGGTADAVVFDEATSLLEVIDFKTGFVRRRAKANYQLIIYALGAYRKLSRFYTIKRVKLTIIQPDHSDEPDSWVLDAKKLETWGARIRSRITELEEHRAAGTLPPFAPSPERCQFCKVGKAGLCPELERAATAAAAEDFASYERGETIPTQVAGLTDAEKWTIAERAETWIKNFRESVTSRVLAGTPVEGFKLVEGRGKWEVTDRKALVSHLTAEGFGETDIFVGEPTLVSFNQAKNLYSGKGSSAKREELEKFFERKPGPPVVVPDTDPREAFNAAEEDFADFKREGEDR